MSQNLDKFLSEMSLTRLNGIDARARTLATTVSSSEVNGSAYATQHSCQTEESVIPLASGDFCPTCVEVDRNNVVK